MILASFILKYCRTVVHRWDFLVYNHDQDNASQKLMLKTN